MVEFILLVIYDVFFPVRNELLITRDEPSFFAEI